MHQSSLNMAAIGARDDPNANIKLAIATTPNHPVYEVVAGQPSWGTLSQLVTEKMACMVVRSAVFAVKTYGRSSIECEQSLVALNNCLNSELPVSVVRDILNICLARDKFRCHHKPFECLALELWRIFYNYKFQDVSVVHHEFAFSKTTNYPDIVQNIVKLLRLIANSAERMRKSVVSDDGGGTSDIPSLTSFKLELKHCEVGYVLQDKVVHCVAGVSAHLKVLEIPGLGSDELLHVIALHCTNLEVLNIGGSREQVSDSGFARYIKESSRKARSKLFRLDITRCMFTRNVLVSLRELTGLRELSISSRVLDEISRLSNGETSLTGGAEDFNAVDRAVLPSVTSINVEYDSAAKAMAYLRHMFPNAPHVALTNCIACELHVTLGRHPLNVTYMREHVHTLDLISTDYFNFPHYPCPNLESLHIEKPTIDLFNIDHQNVPFMYGDTVEFVNLKILKLSRIIFINLTQFLSRSNNLKSFKVTNIGRRERPRWTDEKIRQILPSGSVPRLEDFHVSCLPKEGLSTVESHKYLHLTNSTIQYLTENFVHLKRVAGIETWTPKDCDRESLNSLLHSNKLSGKFSVISI